MRGSRAIPLGFSRSSCTTVTHVSPTRSQTNILPMTRSTKYTFPVSQSMANCSTSETDKCTEVTLLWKAAWQKWLSSRLLFIYKNMIEICDKTEAVGDLDSLTSILWSSCKEITVLILQSPWCGFSLSCWQNCISETQQTKWNCTFICLKVLKESKMRLLIGIFTNLNIRISLRQSTFTGKIIYNDENCTHESFIMAIKNVTPSNDFIKYLHICMSKIIWCKCFST